MNRRRLAELGPVLAALAYHGLALQRPLLAVAAAVALLAGLALWRGEPARGWSWHCGLAGMALALAWLGGSELAGPSTPHGAVPPGMLSPLTGALAGFAAAFAAGRRLTPAWISAATLAALSASVPARASPGWLGPGCALLALLSLLALAGPPSRARLLAGAAFLGLTVTLTAALTWASSATEGVLSPLFEAVAPRHGFATGLALQPEVALAARSTPSQADALLFEIDSPPPARLRTQVLDRFDGQRWSASEALLAPQDEPAPHSGATSAFTLSFLASLRGAIPAPAGLLQVDGAVATLSHGGLLLGEARRGDQLRLQVAAEARPLPGDLPGPELTALPDQLAQDLAPLAAGITAGLDEPAAQAAAIESHLAHAHSYSLVTDLRGDVHPLVLLLRERRPASCVHFASAMAALLRVRGVPARVVGGFQPWETNALTGSALVRGRDAHLWVEAWLPERGGWVAFDPTPAHELGAPPSGLAGLLGALRSGALGLVYRLRRHPDQVLLAALRSWPGAILALAGLTWLLRSRLRRWRARAPRAAPLRDPRLWPLYHRFRRLLARRGGIAADPGISDDELLEQAARQLSPEAAEASLDFLRAYRLARYAGLPQPNLRARLGRLERAIPMIARDSSTWPSRLGSTPTHK